MTVTTRFDYVRIIFRIDWDAFQAQIVPQVRLVERQCRAHVEDATTYTMAPLGTDAQDVARYALDVWGELADYFLLQMPVGWWDLVYRLDLRYSDPAITKSAVAGIGAFFTTKEPGPTGINTFNTPGARKNNKRDVGGRGIRIGSRKSDKHAVLYKRASEQGAFEFRVQGKYAKRLAQTALVNTTSDHLGAVYETAFGMMEAEAAMFLRNSTSKSNYLSLCEWGERYLSQVRFHETVADAKQEAEADEWAKGLPEQEQFDLQAASWVPTAKGLHEPGQ